MCRWQWDVLCSPPKSASTTPPLSIEGREEGVEEELVEGMEEKLVEEEKTNGEEAAEAAEEAEEAEETEGAEEDGEVVRVVNKLSLKYFCGRLIEYFNTMFRRGENESSAKPKTSPKQSIYSSYLKSKLRTKLKLSFMIRRYWQIHFPAYRRHPPSAS